MSYLRNLSISQRISLSLVGTLLTVAIASGLLLVTDFLHWDVTGYVMDTRLDHVIVAAAARTSDGHLALQHSAQLDSLERVAPGLWFIVRDQEGEQVSVGRVSAPCASAVASLPRIYSADITDNNQYDNLSCRIKTMRTDLGEVQIAYGGGPLIPAWKGVGLAVLQYLEAPFFLPLLLVNIVTIPVVVALALRRLKDVVQLARYVDIDRRGLRLPEEGLPREIAPLVRAFNAALERLDAGRTQQDRFIANAAHELRTPVAVIRARLDALESGPLKAKLEQDVERLSELSDALLDLQALKSTTLRMEVLNLVALVRDTLGDLAPVVLTAGHDVEFVCDTEQLDVSGDAASLKRVIVNLVQNAIKHGGNATMLTVTVKADAAYVLMEFVDTGPGIPPAWRDQIFESFSRYTRHGAGAGLGLSIVREIATMHGGRASYFEPPTHGTGIRVSLPRIGATADA
ncbi:sensor histidine kinase [Paraburkholderia phenazinium]|uniref:histidine kinase n=1 Tax=Paraburkholderia phenazinium TaxID=60549 RepID=A0A1N6GW71_9BURK|nr:HAMP domain-containing sensor histidine kinase [Paraburkholderia phenazinium]SIO11687.1 Signal transduction histidine kinase [Paraburkholderia phenazinium]